MPEETNQNTQATEPVAEEVAFHLRPKQKAEDAVEYTASYFLQQAFK